MSGSLTITSDIEASLIILAATILPKSLYQCDPSHTASLVASQTGLFISNKLNVFSEGIRFVYRVVDGWPMAKIDELLPWAWAQQSKVSLAA